MITGWWFGTWLDYDFPYIGNNHPNWLDFHIFQRGRSTTNQIMMIVLSFVICGWVKSLVPLVNIKIAGKWMFIPLKMVSICIYRYWPVPILCEALNIELSQVPLCPTVSMAVATNGDRHRPPSPLRRSVSPESSEPEQLPPDSQFFGYA